MQEPWHPENASCDSIRKPGRAEAVGKKMSEVTLKVSEDIPGRVIRIFSAATLPAPLSFIRR